MNIFKWIQLDLLWPDASARFLLWMCYFALFFVFPQICLLRFKKKSRFCWCLCSRAQWSVDIPESWLFCMCGSGVSLTLSPVVIKQRRIVICCWFLQPGVPTLIKHCSLSLNLFTYAVFLSSQMCTFSSVLNVSLRCVWPNAETHQGFYLQLGCSRLICLYSVRCIGSF